MALGTRDESTMRRSSTVARLVELVQAMAEDDQLALLRGLVEKRSKGRRQYERESYSAVVDYSTEDGFCTDYIKDISAGGMFIETRRAFRVGQEMQLVFPLPNQEKHVKTMGEVTRITAQGIGVKFSPTDQDQQEMIESLSQAQSGTR